MTDAPLPNDEPRTPRLPAGGPPPLPTPDLTYAQRIVRPWWVRLGLWGTPRGRLGRGLIVAMLWLCVLFAAASVAAAFWFPLALAGVSALLSAAWYWGCLYWVDRYDQWD